MKILIVDDHSLVREGLQAILSRSDLAAHCQEAWDAQTLWEQLDRNPDLDLVLLDLGLPGCSGLDLLARIVEGKPELPVVILSGDHDPRTVKRALELGASGFVPKSSLGPVLVSAIRLVASGGVYIPREALQQQLPAEGSRAGAPDPARGAGPVSVESLGLTARQVEVFALLLQGMSNKQICRAINLAEATVKIHVRGVLRVLNVNSRAEAIAKARQIGVLVPEAGAQTPGPRPPA